MRIQLGKNNAWWYLADWKCSVIVCKAQSEEERVSIQREFAVWLRKLKQGLCINLEGWDGAGDGRKLQKGGDICIPMADSC